MGGFLKLSAITGTFLKQSVLTERMFEKVAHVRKDA